MHGGIAFVATIRKWPRRIMFNSPVMLSNPLSAVYMDGIFSISLPKLNHPRTHNTKWNWHGALLVLICYGTRHIPGINKSLPGFLIETVFVAITTKNSCAPVDGVGVASHRAFWRDMEQKQLFRIFLHVQCRYHTVGHLFWAKKKKMTNGNNTYRPKIKRWGMIGVHYRLHNRTQLYQSLMILKEHWVEKFFGLSLGKNQVSPNVLSN